MSRRPEDEDRIQLDRRGFLKVGGLGAAALAVGGAAACAKPGPGTAAANAEASAQASTPSWITETFELEEMTLAQLQSAMASGRYTSRHITELYLDRISRLDRAGPKLRAVIETNPDALDIAARLDDERKAGKARGPLHGIPILVKDNVGTADRMTTTAGSWALEGSIPPEDSGVAKSLRAAGAIILGKANLSEWANFRSNRSVSGWSGRGGQCGNPYAVDRNPCGSSSGSGAGASANFAAAAIGTETDGSIVCPSSLSGVVGIKPTVGLVSRAVIVPISHSQDTAGPMARTVTDAAVILGALTGVDARDPATAASRGHSYTDYTQFLKADGLKGMRIGVERSYFGRDDRVDALMEEALKVMSAAGATIVDKTILQNKRKTGGPEYQVLLYEFKADIDKYLQALGPSAPAHTLADLIAFNDAHKDKEMPFFGQEVFLEAEEKGPLTSPEYVKALHDARLYSRDLGIDGLMEKHKLDAIVAPTGRAAWVTDLVNGDSNAFGSSGPAAVAGYPNITVPNGLIHGLPVGISFFGRAWSEPTLLRIAFAYEQATHHRTAPKLLPSLDLRDWSA
jgi:amidase